jgi:formylmethanofuran dehydrogenase subunit E
MSDKVNPRIFCRICGEPVSLKADTVVDEDGKAVHEECYVKQTTATNAGQQEAS